MSIFALKAVVAPVLQRKMSYLPVQLNSRHCFALVQQHSSILEQQGLDLGDVILLGKLHSLVPLAEQNTAVNSFLRLSCLQQQAACHGLSRYAQTPRQTMWQGLYSGGV